MLSRFAKLSIRSKFLLSSSLTLFLISLFIFSYYPAQQKKQIYQAIKTKNQNAAEIISLGVSIGMGSGDFSIISNAMRWSKSDSNLIGIIVLDENDDIYASYSPKNDSIKLEVLKHNANNHIVELPVYYENVYYGKLIYVSSLEHVYKSIEENLNTTLKVCLLILFVGILFSYFLSSFITKPLVSISEAALKVSQGNLNIKFDISGSREISVLGQSFQKMIDNLVGIMNSLRESEKKYQILSDASPVGIIRTDASGKGIYVNEKWCQISGMDPEDVIDKIWLDKIHPDDRKRAILRWKRANIKNIPFESELRFVDKNNQKRWVFAQSIISKDNMDKTIGYIGTITDISAQKRIELINRSMIKILESINVTSNLEELLSIVDTVMSNLIDTTNFYVALYDNKTEIYSFPYLKDEYDNDATPLKLENSLTDYVRRTGKPLFYTEDINEKLIKDNNIRQLGTKSPIWLGVPLRTPRGIIGVATVQSYHDPYCYTYDDLNIMTMASGHIAMAIERKLSDDELKNSEILLRATLESTADGILVVDQMGQVTNANHRFAEMWKIPEELLKTDNDEKLLFYVLDQLSDPQAFVTKVQSLYNSIEESMDTLYFKDGRIFDRYSCPLLHDDKVIGRVWSFRDITKSKQAERKLSELAVFPEANPNIVISIDKDLNITYINSATKKILDEIGLDDSEIKSCLPSDYRNIIDEVISDEKNLENIESVINGHTWLWSFIPVANQQIVHGYAIDITEQIQQEKEMRKLSTVVNQSSNLVCIVDTNLTIEYINPYFTSITGYKLSEVIGEPVQMLYSNKHDKNQIDEIWDKVKKGENWTGNLQNRKKNDDLYWERQTISPIYSIEGELINFLITGSDITSELLTQQKLMESDKLSAVGTLAAGVSHEFKNYLGGIIGNASFSLDELDSDDGMEIARDTLTKIIEMGEKANDVAMALLTFSKARPEEFHVEDLKKLTNKTIKMIESDLKNASIEIITHYEDVHQVEISPSKIQQLILNLLINAKQAIKENGVISIMLKNKPDLVELRIGDSGPGIPKDNLSKIFDPFFSTKGVWGEDTIAGTGMGLSICRNIAKEHGGDLEVESIEGMGTTFFLTLPAKKKSNYKISKSTASMLRKGILIFSMDNKIYTKFFETACESNINLLLVDDFTKVPDKLNEITEFIICDAKFTAKLELLKMVELSIQCQIPYVMINCGMKEYQLEDLYQSSKANFKDVPELLTVLEVFKKQRSKV